MTFEHKEGQGSLFKNTYKQKDDQPDYKGTVKLSGKDYDIAAWIKDGKNGKFMSLKVSEPWKPGYPHLKEQDRQEATQADDLDSEIPF